MKGNEGQVAIGATLALHRGDTDGAGELLDPLTKRELLDVFAAMAGLLMAARTVSARFTTFDGPEELLQSYALLIDGGPS